MTLMQVQARPHSTQLMRKADAPDHRPLHRGVHSQPVLTGCVSLAVAQPACSLG